MNSLNLNVQVVMFQADVDAWWNLSFSHAIPAFDTRPQTCDGLSIQCSAFTARANHWKLSVSELASRSSSAPLLLRLPFFGVRSFSWDGSSLAVRGCFQRLYPIL